MPKNSKNKKEEFVYAVGRRRASSARVRLYKGSGKSLVNSVPVEEYFPGLINKLIWEKPFKLTNTLGKYYVSVKVEGGGKIGQLEASILGISKALVKENKDFKSLLRRAELLTRDARTRERRKVGTGGKARREKQSPKR